MAEGIQIKNLPSTTTIKQGDTMTIVQDKQNKQLSLDVFANESDLGTLSPLENRCDEVKAKIEVDEYSAEITTSQSMSKIGSGDSGVDLHENVLDGAFESCVLKGKTKYRDIDTGEILEDFEEGRNLELITVRMPILHTVGKNLFDIGKDTNHCWQGTTEFVDGRIKVTSTHNDGVTFHRTYNIPVKKGRTYHVNVNIEGNGHWYLWKNGDTTKSLNNPFTVDDTFDSVAIGLYCAIGEGNVCYFKPQIEEGTVATTYEDHKTSILSFNQKDDKTIVLRSLPNGVCDTLNVETGEYVQRIGEAVFDGSNDELWSIANGGVKNNTIAFGYIGLDGAVKGTYALCDKFVYPISYPEDREGIQTQSSNLGQIYISIFNSKLPTLDSAGFKQWLSQNPVTVQYELATPIVSTIDIQGFPYAYTNGHVQLSSGSIEPSLTPTVTYKVPVSRVGQIASNTKSNLRQTIKLDQLEVLVYQSLINTEYENLLVQNSVESATSFTNLSTNDPKDGLYYMLKHLIEENQPVQNMLDKINLFYLYGLLSDEHYFDLLLGGEEDVY